MSFLLNIAFVNERIVGVRDTEEGSYDRWYY